MPSFKLVYFNLMARAEYSRMIFTLAGQKFEDKRIELEDWPSVKPTTPGGKLPYLEVDGEVLMESVAISQYLSKLFGFSGSNNWEEAKINQIVYTMVDLFNAIVPKIAFEIKDEAGKAAVKKKFIENIAPPELTKLVEILGTGNYFILEKINLADVYVFNCTTILSKFLGVDFFKGYPTLQAHHDRVVKEPRLSAYLKARVDTFV